MMELEGKLYDLNGFEWDNNDWALLHIAKIDHILKYTKQSVARRRLLRNRAFWEAHLHGSPEDTEAATDRFFDRYPAFHRARHF